MNYRYWADFWFLAVVYFGHRKSRIVHLTFRIPSPCPVYRTKKQKAKHKTQPQTHVSIPNKKSYTAGRSIKPTEPPLVNARQSADRQYQNRLPMRRSMQLRGRQFKKTRQQNPDKKTKKQKNKKQKTHRKAIERDTTVQAYHRRISAAIRSSGRRCFTNFTTHTTTTHSI